MESSQVPSVISAALEFTDGGFKIFASKSWENRRSLNMAEDPTSFTQSESLSCCIGDLN